MPGALTFLGINDFYPRTVLAFGYCRCLRLCVSVCVCVCVCACVCQSVCQSLTCPDNSRPKVQNNLGKDPIVLWSDRPWPSRSNLRLKSKLTQFWACPHHNSSPIQTRITKFGPDVQYTLVNIPVIVEGDWPWPTRSNFNLQSQNFQSHHYLKYITTI